LRIALTLENFISIFPLFILHIPFVFLAGKPPAISTESAAGRISQKSSSVVMFYRKGTRALTLENFSQTSTRGHPSISSARWKFSKHQLPRKFQKERERERQRERQRERKTEKEIEREG
jgi:hypothetical protein